MLRRDYSISCEYLLSYVWAACLIKHQQSEQQVMESTQKVCLPPGTNASTCYHLCLFSYLPFITMIFWAWYLSDCLEEHEWIFKVPEKLNDYSRRCNCDRVTTKEWCSFNYSMIYVSLKTISSRYVSARVNMLSFL